MGPLSKAEYKRIKKEASKVDDEGRREDAEVLMREGQKDCLKTAHRHH